MQLIDIITSSILSSKSRKIPSKLGLRAVQGHARSSILVPVDSAYATSY